MNALSVFDTAMSDEASGSMNGLAAPHRNVDAAAFFAREVFRLKVGFYAALVFALLGFLVVFCSLFLLEGGLQGVLAGLGGALLVELLAGMFLLYSMRARRGIGEFFLQRSSEEQAAITYDLIDRIEDSARRDELIAQLVLRRAATPQSRGSRFY